MRGARISPQDLPGPGEVTATTYSNDMVLLFESVHQKRLHSIHSDSILNTVRTYVSRDLSENKGKGGNVAKDKDIYLSF